MGGPEFAFNAGLAANAELKLVPCWTLDAPVRLTAGLEIEVLDVEAGPITVYKHTFRLAETAPCEEGWSGHGDETLRIHLKRERVV